MRTLIALLGLLFIAMPLRAAPDLTAHVAALLREEALDGAVWTTLDRHGAAGVSDARSGAPMRADQRVHVGSIAKTVVATGVLRLASEGRLSIDMPVSRLLPALVFDNPWERSDPVRIRHLLDHTSGLDDAHLWQIFSLAAHPDAPLAAAFPPGQGLLRVRSRPGTRTSYSNMGYTVLGMAIEAVSGQRYEHYLDRALLRPLGMRDSTFAFVSRQSDPRLAMGHFENGAAQGALPSHLRPAGQFTTTAADMARFARFLMGDGRLGGRPFVDAALLRQMGEPAGTEAARAGLRVGHGLGLRTFDRHGAVARCHGGNGVGFRAMFCLFPGARQAFFIAINTDSETADYQRFDKLLTQALLPASPAPAPPPGARPAVDLHPWEGWYVPSPNRFETVRFFDTLFGFLRAEAEGDALYLKTFQAETVKLEHAGGALFRAPGKILASHALLIPTEGTPIISTGTQTFERAPRMRLLALWSSVAAGMAGLAWILVKSMARLARRRLSRREPLALPLVGMLALLFPLPFFLYQPLARLGDLTLASGLLALVTGMLPLTMAVGLARGWRTARTDRADLAAMAAVLQLAAVLAAWGLLPLRLWA